jgi:hypothetical protein
MLFILATLRLVLIKLIIKIINAVKNIGDVYTQLFDLVIKIDETIIPPVNANILSSTKFIPFMIDLI